ncbi:MAG: peptidoglycan-binding protein [Clostridia bacterium]|jgi:cell wall-associated NlpC family hydrolase
MKKIKPVLCGCIAMGLLLSSGFYQKANAASTKGTINANKVNFRTGASLTSDVITRLRKGEEVRVRSQSGDWVKVTFNNRTGYVFKSYVNVAKSSSGSSSSLRYEDRGDAVKKVQKALKDKGFLNGKVDGIFGRQTLAAVEAFQRRMGLKVDGIVGPKTQQKLFNDGDSSRGSSSSGILKVGSKGKAVIDLQKALKAKGYYTYKVTGVYGSITRAAVKDFQKDARIKVDGIAGPVTLKKLSSSSVKKSSSSRSSADRSSSSSSSRKGSDVVAYAKKFIGVPYRYGGSSPKTGFDCSGFTSYVYKHFGVKLPRSSRDQLKVGTAVSRSNLKPGDLVLFGNPVHHVGIYVGDDKYIHAPRTGEKVKISKLSGRKFYYARRIFK